MSHYRTKIFGCLAVAVLGGYLADVREPCRLWASESIQAQGTAKRSSVFDKTPAYHWRRIWYLASGRPDYDGPAVTRATEEGWAVRGVGRRAEVRHGGELRSVTVDTPRWHFIWYVSRNVVLAYPSHLENNDSLVTSREAIVRWAGARKATHVTQKEQLNGREVEKMTFTFLADPATGGRSPIHEFDPKRHLRLLQSPDVQFRTRTYWFELETHLAVRYQCGCKSRKHEEWIDYPTPESVPRELLRFQVPCDATLEINDPDLRRRQIVLEPEAGPDLRE